MSTIIFVAAAFGIFSLSAAHTLDPQLGECANDASISAVSLPVSFRVSTRRTTSCVFNARRLKNVKPVGGLDRLKGGAGWNGEGKEYVLRTPCHDHLSYYGIMFDITAKERDVTITGIAMAATTPKPGPYLYRVYVANEPCEAIREREACWVRVGDGRASLPCKIGHYGQLPLQTPVTVRRGATVAVYVHSPECAEGVAYRGARLTGDDDVTDQDDNLQIKAAYASFAIAPSASPHSEGITFEDVQDSPRAVAAVLRYRVASDSEL